VADMDKEVFDKCISMEREGKSKEDVYHYYISEGYSATQETFFRRLRKYKQGVTDNPVKVFDLIETLKKGIQLSELSQRLNISPKACDAVIEDIKSQGYNVQRLCGEIKISNVVVPADNHHDNHWHGEKTIRFGLIGDTHINSKYTQLTHLHKLYDLYKEEGINAVYHAGDIDDGEQMRSGHQYECYTQGADDHVSEIVKVFPERDGIKTFFITGNHDASIIKRCGYDIGYPIANRRSDMIYLGQSSAVVNLTPNCTIELRHPIDGTTYAFSYKPQKLIESISGGEKPNILAIGHYHKAEYIFYRNVHCFQTGTLCAQTPWMKGKQIAAHMGGWIVEVGVDDEGTITRIKQEFIPFYKAIVDDYKNWR
jgi:predicted phosphodiesterase